MKKRALAILFCVFVLGCKGPKGEAGTTGGVGPIGPQGQTGATGDAGALLIKTYVGTIPADGSFVVSVPEIKGKIGKTFVLCYWAYPTSPDIWTPMADGWLDNTTNLGKIAAVSWTFGNVYFSYMSAGLLFRVDVYQNN